MSETETETTETYRLEHDRLSTGTLADPVTGDEIPIHAHDDERGGCLHVTRPDSAVYLVRDNDALTFATPDEKPGEAAVRGAQAEYFGFIETDVAREFVRRRGESLISVNLDASTGFDPESDPPNNGVKVRVQQAHETLAEQGHDNVASFLRALPSVDQQQEFVRYLRERGEYL
jgi:hypothetical protein